MFQSAFKLRLFKSVLYRCALLLVFPAVALGQFQEKAPIRGNQEKVPFRGNVEQYYQGEAQSPAQHIPVGPELPAPENQDGYWLISSRTCSDKNCTRNCCALKFYYKQVCEGDPSRRDEAPIRANKDHFLGSLNPAIPICFVIHGSYYSWKDVVNESRTTYRWIRQAAPDLPLQVVFFSWPSDQNVSYVIPTLDTAALGRRSGIHGLFLARLITELPAETPISLMGHSHGGRMAASILHLLGGGTINRECVEDPFRGTRRIRVVLAAAALDHHWFNPDQRYDRSLYMTEGVLNLRNRMDLALAVYPLHRPFAESSLGMRGLSKNDRRQIGPVAQRLVDYDVSCEIGTKHSWMYYLRKKELACVVAPYIYFSQAENVTQVPQIPLQRSPAPQLQPVRHTLPRPSPRTPVRANTFRPGR